MTSLEQIILIVLTVSGVIYSIILHEIAHGYVARLFGDDTAKLMGRLSLNPIAHIDFYGTIFLPLILYFLGLPVIGWAKPVPVNPNRMEKPAEDFFIVSLAGPITNLFIAVILGLLVRFFHLGALWQTLLFFLVEINLALMIFNLIPIPPLDGSKVLGLFLPPRTFYVLQQWGLYILLGLIIFSSFIPIIPFILNRVVGFFFTLITGQSLTL